MSALREWAATMGPEARQAVAVNAWGKWKTACQVGWEGREGLQSVDAQVRWAEQHACAGGWVVSVCLMAVLAGCSSLLQQPQFIFNQGGQSSL